MVIINDITTDNLLPTVTARENAGFNCKRLIKKSVHGGTLLTSRKCDMSRWIVVHWKSLVGGTILTMFWFFLNFQQIPACQIYYGLCRWNQDCRMDPVPTVMHYLNGIVDCIVSPCILSLCILRCVVVKINNSTLHCSVYIFIHTFCQVMLCFLSIKYLLVEHVFSCNLRIESGFGNGGHGMQD